MRLPFLTCHPATPCALIRRFTVRTRRTVDGKLTLTYLVEGEIGRLRLPAPALPHRADELWRHTCFEAFLKAPDGDEYYEFNFAPSGEWASYRFDGYRTGMANTSLVTAPRIVLRHEPHRLALDVSLNLTEIAASLNNQELRLGLSAVIETETGDISYWAVAHPPGRPDFHHATGFALSLLVPIPSRTPPTRK